MSYSLYDKGEIWSKDTTEINDNRHFRSTSRKTSDKKLTMRLGILANSFWLT